MESTILTKSELQALSKSLPRGARTRIAKQLGLSIDQIRNVLDKGDQNIEVIELALAEVERKKDLQEKVRLIKEHYEETEKQKIA
jgi:hypothetical protein